jgi:hypothetical protein
MKSLKIVMKRKDPMMMGILSAMVEDLIGAIGKGVLILLIGVSIVVAINMTTPIILLVSG